MNAQPFFAEVIGTFFFVSFIMCIKYHNGSKEDLLNAFGVSSMLYGMIFLT
jgi:glycerol uptake facilitator-like aquaporin